MAIITEKQRKVLAKAGVAMPDGSYYIRNAGELDDAIHAVGRGDASHDVIRKHIIKRAAALNLSDKIPGNWNPDGSLKDAKGTPAEHSATPGMNWGVRNQQELEIYTSVALGTSALAERVAVRHAMSSYAQATHKGSVESFSREKALGLLAQKNRVLSGQGSTQDQVELLVPTLPDDVIQHFGRKGMKWGAHVFTGGGSGGGEHTSADAARAHASASTAKKHGTSALSNADLQHLVNRTQLERQYGQLNTRHASQGEKIAKEILINAGKQTAQSYATKYATKGAEHLIKLTAKGVVGVGKHALR